MWLMLNHINPVLNRMLFISHFSHVELRDCPVYQGYEVFPLVSPDLVISIIIIIILGFL